MFAKTFTAQVLAFPVYLGGLFTYMGVMENIQDEEKFHENTRTKSLNAFIAGAFFWPLANGFNFAIVPASLRVPVVAATAGVWSAFLSWYNAKSVKDIKNVGL